MSSRWDAGGEGPKDPQQEAAERAAAIAAKFAPPKPAAPPPAADPFDGDFTQDIEINDLRNRYLLTKGQTQQQIHSETGASITTKGVWLPDKSKATAAEPPLYLHIAATSQEILDKAVAKVNELIASDLGPLIEDRSQWAKNRERFGGDRPGGGPPERRKWPEEKIVIGLESLRNFNVRAKVVGPGGLFVKHIQSETGTRVQIKGQGSGFYEQDTGRESDDPMHISIAGPEDQMIENAKLLAEDLLLVVRSEWQKARDSMNQPVYPQGQMYGGGGMGGGYQQQYQPQQPSSAYQAPPPPPPEDGAPPPPPSEAAPALPGAPAPAAAPAGAAEGEAEAYRAYWAAYGYDVKDPAFIAWQASVAQYQQPGAAGAAASPATQQQQQQRVGAGSYAAVPPPAGL